MSGNKSAHAHCTSENHNQNIFGRAKNCVCVSIYVLLKPWYPDLRTSLYNPAGNCCPAPHLVRFIDLVGRHFWAEDRTDAHVPTQKNKYSTYLYMCSCCEWDSSPWSWIWWRDDSTCVRWCDYRGVGCRLPCPSFGSQSACFALCVRACVRVLRLIPHISQFSAVRLLGYYPREEVRT